jgi:hypothetical protein
MDLIKRKAKGNPNGISKFHNKTIVDEDSSTN